MKSCLRCQKEFEPKKPKAKFCSDNCRVYYGREKKTGRAIVPKKAKLIIVQPNKTEPVRKLDEIIKDVLPTGLHEKNVNTVDVNEIQKQIDDIRNEKIPKERDTRLGRISWQNDQAKRILELKNKLK